MKEICDKKMTFSDCELAILRAAVDKAEERQGRQVANSPEIKRIIGIVENFLRKKHLAGFQKRKDLAVHLNNYDYLVAKVNKGGSRVVNSTESRMIPSKQNKQEI